MDADRVKDAHSLETVEDLTAWIEAQFPHEMGFPGPFAPTGERYVLLALGIWEPFITGQNEPAAVHQEGEWYRSFPTATQAVRAAAAAFLLYVKAKGARMGWKLTQEQTIRLYWRHTPQMAQYIDVGAPDFPELDETRFRVRMRLCLSALPKIEVLKPVPGDPSRISQHFPKPETIDEMAARILNETGGMS